MLPIIGNIAFKLLFPEGFVGFGSRGLFTAFMPVPETAMDKNNGSVFWQNDVRFPGQGFDVFPEAVSGAVQHGADQHFGLRVLPFDLRHVPRTLFR
ncbi:MAG: hypothetical protein MUC65_09880 [Pontiellaceae bacterium]|nr:hypothetical protein [Pontiellaceae bacterium]